MNKPHIKPIEEMTNDEMKRLLDAIMRGGDDHRMTLWDKVMSAYYRIKYAFHHRRG
jgi:hypothetical protein